MKKLVSIIPPHLLLLIPVLIAVLVLVFISDHEVTKQDVSLHASFFKMPEVNLFQTFLSLF